MGWNPNPTWLVFSGVLPCDDTETTPRKDGGDTEVACLRARERQGPSPEARREMWKRDFHKALP